MAARVQRNKLIACSCGYKTTLQARPGCLEYTFECDGCGGRFLVCCKRGKGGWPGSVKRIRRLVV